MEATFTIDQDGQIKNPKTVGDFFRQHGPGTYNLVSKSANLRSLGQNNYYWYIVVPLVKDGLRDLGFDEIKTNEQAHGYLKEKFLKKFVHNRNNPEEVIELPGTTTELTTVQFMAFIAEVQQWAAEWLQTVIPDPNQSLELDYPNQPSPEYGK